MMAGFRRADTARFPTENGKIVHKGTVVNAVVFLLAVSLLVSMAAYFMLRGVDLSAVRPEIIARVKAATGRDLQIAGDLEVALRQGLIIRAHRLALGNAEWGSRPEMLKLGYVEAHLALLPLFLGEVRVKRIDLHDVDLVLETDASGRGNWEFEPEASGNAQAVSALPSVRIESGRLTWRGTGERGQEPLIFTELALAADVSRDGIGFEGAARLDHNGVEFSGRLPTWQSLAPGSPQDVTLRLRLGAAEVEGSGTLQQAPWGLSPRLNLRAAALDLAKLGSVAGRSFPSLPQLDVTLDLSRDARGWQVDKLAAVAGKSDLAGELRWLTESDRPKFTATLAAHTIDLTELIPLSDTETTGDTDRAAVSWRPLLDALDEVDGEVQVRASQVVAWDMVLADARVDGRVDAGVLSLEPIKASLSGGGRAEGHLELHAGAQPPAWDLVLGLRKLPAGALLGPRWASLVDAPVDLDLDLQAKGASVHQAVQNLAGDARIVVGSGRARIGRIDSLVGGISTLTGQLLAKGSDEAQLNCVIADFTILRGVATADVLLIDSAVSTVRGDGWVDLVTQDLDLTFTPRAKSPTLNIAVPVHVRGPMRQPEFTADRGASLGKLLGVAGLFVYPPAALLALGDLGGSGNACIELMRENAAPQGAGSVDSSGRQEGEGSIMKGISRGLKGLFGQ